MCLLIPTWAHVISRYLLRCSWREWAELCRAGASACSPYASESPAPFPLQLFFTLTPEAAGAPRAPSHHTGTCLRTPSSQPGTCPWVVGQPLPPLPCKLALCFASCSCCLSDISVSCDLLYLSSPLVHGYQVFRSESLESWAFILSHACCYMPTGSYVFVHLPVSASSANA